MSALVCMNIAVFIWGFTGVLGRAISINEISLVFWRLAITVFSLWIGSMVFAVRLRKLSPKIFASPATTKSKRRYFSKDTLFLMIPGMIIGLHWICFYGSIKYANASLALTCLGAAPLLAAILEPLFFRRVIQSSELFLGTLVFIGILIIYYSHLHFSVGIIYGIFAVILTVIVSVLNKHLVTKHSPIEMITFQMTGALLAVSLVFPLYATVFQKYFEFPSVMDVVYLIILSWGCTIFTFLLWMIALQEVSAFTSNVLLTMEPIYGIVLAFALFKEYLEISSYFYVGFFLIVLAVILNTYRIRRPTEQMRS